MPARQSRSTKDLYFPAKRSVGRSPKPNLALGHHLPVNRQEILPPVVARICLPTWAQRELDRCGVAITCRRRIGPAGIRSLAGLEPPALMAGLDDVAMVSEGLGITLLPDLAVRAVAVCAAEIRLSLLPDACPGQVVLASRPGSARRSLFHKLGEVLINGAGST